MRVAAVLSGGLDSTTLAYLLHRQGQLARCLSVDYGQRHRRELGYAAATAARLGVAHDVIDLTGVTHLIGTSALTGGGEVPEGHYAQDTMRATVVPNRNLLMVSACAAVAISEGLDGVAVGVHAGDHPIYPDCRPEFIDAAAHALRVGNEGFAAAGFDLWAPFVHATKTDIARLAAQLDVPVAATWSCYQGGDRHCGRCGTCVERIEALHDAGVEDPTDYQDPAFWRDVVAGRP